MLPRQRRERLAKWRVRVTDSARIATAKEERPEASILTEYYNRRDRLKRRVSDMNRLSLATYIYRDLAAES